MRTVEKEIIAYTAGIVDGEGSIQINPIHSTGSKKKFWGLAVQVSNGNRKVLNWLKNKWMLGSITPYHPKHCVRTFYNWRIYSFQAEWFLNKLLPYLIIKKKNAEIALEFRKYISPKRDSITKDMSEKRRELALMLRELNQRFSKKKKIYANELKKYEVI